MVKIIPTIAVAPRFPLGSTYLSRGVFSECLGNIAFQLFVLDSLERHASGDWGDLEKEDKTENEFSLTRHLRILSAYVYPISGKKIWIITEADRSTTTVLFPEEY